MTSPIDTIEIFRLNALNHSLLEMCDALIVERDAARAEALALHSAISAVSQRGIQRMRAHRAKDRSEFEDLREANKSLVDSNASAIRAYQRLHSQINEPKVIDNTLVQQQS